MSNTPPPSEANGYAIPPGQYATTAFFQAVFTSVHERLHGLEAQEADYQAAIDYLTTQALASVSATLTQEISGQRAALEDIQTQAEAVLLAYDQISLTGVPATQIRVAAIGTFDPPNVQAAIANIAPRLKAAEDATTALDTATDEALSALAAATNEALSTRLRVDDAQTLGSAQRKFGRDNLRVPSFRQARHRNRINDPALLVSQQNYNTASSANGWYASDAWHKGLSGTGLNNSFGRVFSLTPGGSPFRLRFTNGLVKAALATGDYDVLIAEVEDVEVPEYRFGFADAKRLTFRFGCRLPAGTWPLKIGNLGGTRSYLTSFVVTAGEANSDIVKTIEIPGDVSGVWSVMNNAIALTIAFGLVAGSTWTGVAGWQAGNFLAPPGCSNFASLPVNTVAEFFDFQIFIGLEVGEEPPPFDIPSYEETLRKCQRYYESGYYHLVATAGGGSWQTTDNPRFKATKRVSPSVALSTDALSNTPAVYSDSATPDMFRLYGISGEAGGFTADGRWGASARM